MVAWLAILGMTWVGCSRPEETTVRKPHAKSQSRAQSADEKALEELGEKVYATFVSGKSSELKPLTLWGVPEPELDRAMQAVYIADAKTSLAQLETIPATNRTALHKGSIQERKAFLAKPDEKFKAMKSSLQKELDLIKTAHLKLFEEHTGQSAQDRGLDWSRADGPNVLVRRGVDANSAMPQAAVEVFFSLGGDNYKLQLNTCVKLPEHGWCVAEGFAWIDLVAEAAVNKMWMQDFPAAQVRARDEKKRLFVGFTGSDWCPPCIALHEKVLSTKAFLNYAKESFVLVTVDFPKNKIQPNNLAQANQILARAFHVDSFPAVLILEANGTEVHRVSGYDGAAPSDYLKALKNKLNP
jgi:thioredoxin-related protein|tara:strand:- start:2387 stop:3451 length:1065 start_codon:yes stop_codon:yes gene_type:complete